MKTYLLLAVAVAFKTAKTARCGDFLSAIHQHLAWLLQLQLLLQLLLVLLALQLLLKVEHAAINCPRLVIVVNFIFFIRNIFLVERKPLASLDDAHEAEVFD